MRGCCLVDLSVSKLFLCCLFFCHGRYIVLVSLVWFGLVCLFCLLVGWSLDLIESDDVGFSKIPRVVFFA